MTSDVTAPNWLNRLAGERVASTTRLAFAKIRDVARSKTLWI